LKFELGLGLGKAGGEMKSSSFSNRSELGLEQELDLETDLELELELDNHERIFLQMHLMVAGKGCLLD